MRLARPVNSRVGRFQTTVSSSDRATISREGVMSEPYTIRVFVPDGDPEGVKIVERLNWTGVGIAFPRSAWPQLSARPEFKRTGVYVLTGSAEGTADELPTVYVGQGDEIGSRIEAHYANKDFWDWGYAFVSAGTALNRAHVTWLEHALLHRAKKARKPPTLSKAKGCLALAKARRCPPARRSWPEGPGRGLVARSEQRRATTRRPRRPRGARMVAKERSHDAKPYWTKDEGSLPKQSEGSLPEPVDE